MGIFDTIGNIASSVGKFFSDSPKLQTARDIYSGAQTVIGSMRDAISGSGIQDFRPEGLVNPQQNFGRFMDRGASRSRAGRPSFSDVGEATYYKYAQLQNTIRYLYGTKSRYKSIAKDK
tara:strand:- start:1809 stop:2165 length:357 start_codon:yes stop_codon:yes gene_type:complete